MPPDRIRQRKVLTIWRDDHVGDEVGGIFLDPEGQGAAFERLASYLGTVKIRRVEMIHDRLKVEVEAWAFPEESKRLVAAAASQRVRGARRNAESLFREALDLDPLNVDLILELSRFFAERNRYDAVLKTLIRAREIAGDLPDVMRAMGEVCLKLERFPSALDYFQRALEGRPDDPVSRRALIALGRQPPALAEPPPAVEEPEARPEPTRIALARKRQKP